MNLQQDYSYQFDWDQKYCYPNSSILRNKLGIKDPEVFEKLLFKRK
jgi:cell filamentation protein